MNSLLFSSAPVHYVLYADYYIFRQSWPITALLFVILSARFNLCQSPTKNLLKNSSFYELATFFGDGSGDAGPDFDTRANSVMHLWGKVSNAKGESLEATMNTLEGFTLTTNSSLACVERILAGEVTAGCLTSTQAFGTDLVMSLPGTEVHWPR